jgi:cyclic pyranopterin monophosphate synthase
MSELTHVDEGGRVRMVDVSHKHPTARTAMAAGTLTCAPATLELVREGKTPKGAVISTAELAGIMAAKRTAELVPLCHPLPLTNIEVRVRPDDALPGFQVEAQVRTKAVTGVEMEALTAVAVGLLAVYDMCKAVDRGMRIEGVRLLEKSGGKSGHYVAP